MSDKPIQWIGTSKKDLKNFPSDARRKAGLERAISSAWKTTY